MVNRLLMVVLLLIASFCAVEAQFGYHVRDFNDVNGSGRGFGRRGLGRGYGRGYGGRGLGVYGRRGLGVYGRRGLGYRRGFG
ncbi:sulfur globule protein CV2 domain protein [Teladorsagia circumcincta]|uniref:Sulfur globule protein CV2 domain protein n=1 Tax=Teladorsagia circumcincta TaxID=45464 RepID=A0A2G9V716_TELCI|nr:sulfur globule protein CV2 domain protein [Teladorsagia circumcincta]